MKLLEILNSSQYKDIIQNRDGVYFPLDPTWHDIAVSLSGGADSALLAYMLCKTITENKMSMDVHIITNIRMWKTRPWQETISLEVFEYLVNKFPNLKFIRHVNFIAPQIEYGVIGPIIKDEYGRMKSGDQISTRSYSEYVCHYNNINAWFAGVTRNPRDETITQGMDDRNVDFNSVDDLHLTIMQVGSKLSCHPFVFSTKQWIIKQYLDYGILDLLNITRSCEGEFEELDYTTYKPGMLVPECGTCFWCQERNWAKKLNNV